MKRITSNLFAVAIVLVVGLSAHAQNKSALTNPSAEKLALIKELIALSGQSSNQIADEMYDAQMGQAKAMMSRMFDSDESFTPAEKAYFRSSSEESFDRIAKQINEFVKTELGLDAMIDEVAVTSYDKHFSEGELQDLLAFYKSPTGKKSISVGPEIMREMVAYMFEKVMPKFEAFIKRTVDAEFAIIKEKSPALPTKRRSQKKSFSKTK